MDRVGETDQGGVAVRAGMVAPSGELPGSGSYGGPVLTIPSKARPIQVEGF